MSNLPETDTKPESLRSVQTAFAAYLRDPDNEAAPEGIEKRRVDIYRQLFFNNINKFLSGNFPVLRQITDDKAWRQLVRDFCVEHRCHTPLFPELPKEFLRYLQDTRKERPGDPPFMLELAHYEWVELALSLDETELDQVEANPDGDFMEEVPVLSPLAWPLSYHYPLHLICPDFIPRKATGQATHLLAWRNRKDKICFMEMNQVTRLLMQILQENRGLSGRKLLTEIAEKINHPDPSKVIDGGAQLFEELRGKDILLGTRTPTT
jgi:hypothetical protein